MMKLELIPYPEFLRVRNLDMNEQVKLEMLADMCRINALVMVKNAGSGHLGSSLSSMEIVTWLYYKHLNIHSEGTDSPDRDIYFSSKGHDVPGLYAVLFSVGILTEDQILKLRRLGGLDGHPDVHIKGIEANSGSLGMGISKGRGMAWAKRKLNRKGHIYVITGDGEFQEGQNNEALQSCVQQNISGITVIMDHNKVQSDKPVEEVVSLANLMEKIRSFGWHVVRMNGHSFEEIEHTFDQLKSITDKPKFIIADTIKGRGVSFMEHPYALEAGKGLYPWHAGAPDDESFQKAFSEVTDRVNSRLAYVNAPALHLKNTEEIRKSANHQVPLNALGEPISEAAVMKHPLKKAAEYVVEAYGHALVKEGAQRHDLVVLDADLSSDCRLRYFENTFPDRFIENGIAEQDMVSMAGGLARMGLLPVVNSFASFLASRANEQIYNNCTERTRIIYANHYAGLIPAGPGKSHQSIRDISLLGALPNMEIIQPCNTAETEMAVDYCVNRSVNSCTIRMNISPSPRNISVPDNYKLIHGRGVVLRSGSHAILFAYGPVMLNEALSASELLAVSGIGLEIVNMPWLNRVDIGWLENLVKPYNEIFVLEDHAPVGGLGDFLLQQMVKADILGSKKFNIFSVEGYPACGTPSEALKYHGLDGESLAKNIKSFSYVEQNCF
jgi:transketolase